jgi:p38 MAP kinase
MQSYIELHDSLVQNFNIPKNPVIGRGAFGMVLRATTKGDVPLDVAIKLQQGVEFPIIENELRILDRLQGHPNILKLIPDLSILDPGNNCCYTVCELMHTDLHRFHQAFRKKDTFMPPSFVKQILLYILEGLAHMHKNDVIHRDLKPQNVLIGKHFNDIKIADFGISVLADHHPIVNNYEICTRWYRAPELLMTGGTYGPSIDVWSAGCIFAELVLGRPLFKSANECELWNRVVEVLGAPSLEFVNSAPHKYQAAIMKFHARRNHSILDLIFESKSKSKSIDADGMNLMNRMLAIYSGDRITVGEALAHPYFDSVR